MEKHVRIDWRFGTITGTLYIPHKDWIACNNAEDRQKLVAEYVYQNVNEYIEKHVSWISYEHD